MVATWRPIIVFDVETRRHHEFDRRMGLEEKVAALEEMDLHELFDLAADLDILLGNRNKLESVRPYIADSLRKKADKAALKLFGCEVYAIGCRMVNACDPAMVWVVDDNHDEASVLRAFVDYLLRYGEHAPVLCGFNIREFDIPVVRTRSIVSGLDLPVMFPRNTREDRFDHDNVFDIRDVLSEGTLDDWLRMWDLPPKTGRGDMVEGMSPAEVRQYCADDVERERMLANMVLRHHRTFQEYVE